MMKFHLKAIQKLQDLVVFLFKTPQRPILTIMIVGAFVSIQFQNCAPYQVQEPEGFQGVSELENALKPESDWILDSYTSNQRTVPLSTSEFQVKLTFTEEEVTHFCPGSCPQRYLITLETPCSRFKGALTITFNMETAQHEKSLKLDPVWVTPQCPYANLENWIQKVLDSGDFRPNGNVLEVVSKTAERLRFRRVGN